MSTCQNIGALSLSIGTATLYACLKSLRQQSSLKTLRYRSDQDMFETMIHYLYEKYSDSVQDFFYEEELVYNCNEWRRRKRENPSKLKVCVPDTCDFVITYDYEKDGETIRSKIRITLEYIKDNRGDFIKMSEPEECSQKDYLLKNLTLFSEDRASLIAFSDEAKETVRDIYEKCKGKTKDTMCIYYYKKDYWTLFSKSPKRSIDTVYLKEGEGEALLTQVKEFFSEDTRNIYLKYGIPYKNVSLIYGPPGTGKTSLIKAVASELDCDLFVLAITKDMLDSNLVEAFNYINDTEENDRIIVMEDVDTIFDDRKEGDKNNGITMQGFLNCLDGFTCVEGTMLFMTANKPEVFDQAMIRSCRIDHKLQLDFADKYQTEKMYETFFPENKNFASLYKSIKHLKYTTAMLQEFFFYNRTSKNILDEISEFQEIVVKNDPKNFEVLKEGTKNFYM